MPLAVGHMNSNNMFNVFYVQIHSGMYSSCDVAFNCIFQLLKWKGLFNEVIGTRVTWSDTVPIIADKRELTHVTIRA